MGDETGNATSIKKSGKKRKEKPRQFDISK